MHDVDMSTCTCACVQAFASRCRRLLTCYTLHGYVARSGHVPRAVDGLRRATLHMCMRLYMLDYTCTHGHVEVRKAEERLKLLQALRSSRAMCLCCLRCKGLQGSAGWKSTRHAGLRGHRGVDGRIIWTLAKQHAEILGFFKTSYGA